MKYHPFRFCLLFAIVSGALSYATSIDPLPWQELVMHSDLIAVVECVTGGEAVARYKVTDPWKGPEVGTVFTAFTPIDAWGAMPIALPGQQFLMMARKRGPWALPAFPTSSKDLLLGTEAQACDYVLPLFQGLYPLPITVRRSPFPGSDAVSLEAFKEDVVSLLTKGPEGEERATLIALIEKHLADPNRRNAIPAASAVLEAASSESDVSAILTVVFRACTDADQMSVLRQILRGGGLQTLAFLREDATYGKPYAANPRNESVAQYLESRLRPSETPLDNPYRPATYDTTDIAKAKQAFAEGPENDQFDYAFRVLSIHDPGAVAQWLRTWQNNDTRLGPYRALLYALEFGQKCGADRAIHFASLLDAREPYIQAAAAVFLSYEDNAAGRDALQKKSALDGDPGAWCAITLVGYDDKSAVPRALEIFKGDHDGYTMRGMHHRDLQRRLNVYLSNAAHATGLPPLELPQADHEDTNTDEAYAYITAWWKANEDRVELNNPW